MPSPIKEELEVPYEIKVYRMDSNLRAPKELLSVHSLGKSPVITDGGVTLAETGAIIRGYLDLHLWASTDAPTTKSTLSISTETGALLHQRREN
jgi:glutathione S-transferase